MRIKQSLERFSFIGIFAGTALLALSLTPSLIPRTWAYQAIVSALAFVVGYGAGAGLTALWRYLQLPALPERYRRAASTTLLVLSGVLLLYAAFRSVGWQNELRQMVGMPAVNTVHVGAALLFSAVLAYVLILAFRGLWWVARSTTQAVDRVIPRRYGVALGVLASTVLLIILVNGVFMGLVWSVLNSVYSTRDGGNYENVSPPTSGLRSGSPESGAAWETLGREGRRFVATGPTSSEIEQFAGETPALEPVRVYIGAKSAGTLEERATLGLQELIRTGAFERKLLVLVTSTGNGWVDSNAIDTLEYIHGGDTAVMAFQYSYLPSAISLLADIDAATDASTAMFDEVHQYWASLDETARPDFYIHGLSLGAHGSQAAVSSVQLLNDPIDGALWAGPPFVSHFWQRLTENRDEGTPIWRPAYGGGTTIRFTNQGEGLQDNAEAWQENRFVYIQQAGDPIVLFRPDSLYRPLEWLQSETRTPKAPPSMSWYPVVTFWQLIIDMWLGTKDMLPDGNGHRYGSASYIDGWIALTQPEGWTPARVEDFRNYFLGLGNPNKP